MEQRAFPSTPSRVASPKRRAAAHHLGRASLFGYYAGFDYEWAADVLAGAPHGAVVLDPFNGSGTVTTAATARGMASIGLDRNPVACVIALARLVESEVAASIAVGGVRGHSRALAPRHSTWLAPSSAAYFYDRAEYLLRRGFRASAGASGCALIYVALFRALRALTQRFEGSNPTWVQKPSARRKARPSRARIDAMIRAALQECLRCVADIGLADAPAMISIADSRTLPLASGSVDLIVTSPPYCTRIDYAVATSREQEVLDLSPSGSMTLRTALLGTTLNRETASSQFPLSRRAQDVLQAIRDHGSRDACGYYHRQYLQYFQGLAGSCAELGRVARPGSLCVMVVQESFFRDVRIPLHGIVREEMAAHGWRALDSEGRPVRRNMVTLNASATAARRGSTVSEFELWYSRE